MSISNNHIIKRQVLEINVPKQLEDTDVKEKVKQYLAHRLYPELEKIFDELGSKEEVVRIDNITIDTGVLNIEHITEDIVIKTISAIKKQLVDKIEDAKKSASGSSAVQFISTNETPEKIIQHFLQSGTYPWWHKNNKNILEEQFQLLVEKKPDFIVKLVQQNLGNQNVLLRILNQFSEKFLAHIIKLAGVETYINILSGVPDEKKIKLKEKIKKVESLISVFSPTQKESKLIKRESNNKSEIQLLIERFLNTGLADAIQTKDTNVIQIDEVLYKLFDKNTLPPNALKTTPEKSFSQLIKKGYISTEIQIERIFVKIFGKIKSEKILQKVNTVKLQQKELRLYYQELEKALITDNNRIEILLGKILGKKTYTLLKNLELTINQKLDIIKQYFIKQEQPVLLQNVIKIPAQIPNSYKYIYTIAFALKGKEFADTIFLRYKSKDSLIKKINEIIADNILVKNDIAKNIINSTDQQPIIQSGKHFTNIGKKNSIPNNDTNNVYRTHQHLQLIEYYLLTGILPSININQQHKLIERLFIDFIKKEDESTKKYVWEIISDTNSLKRIVYTFSIEVLDKLIVKLEPSNKNFIKKTIKDFSEIISGKIDSSVSFNTVRSVLYLIVFQFLIQNKGKTFRKEDFLKYILEQTAIKFRKESRSWHKIIIEHVLQNSKNKYTSEFKKYAQRININNIVQDKKLFENNNNIHTEEQDREGYYIENAGLVILHPYLPTMFRNLKLVEKNEFVSEEARERAVLLLQYIVTKEEVVPEHQLVLNKIICGMDITNPVPLHIDITPEEKTEAEEIIKAAVEYWPAIKNTSVEGFRNSFLWREGMIRKEEEKWVLRVERKTYDMLLDKLPWGLSMIKFPWRKDIIYTQW